jgi:four helix bundle protein
MAVNYRELVVYKKARELVIGVDRLIKMFPRTAQAATMASQMFRAATSIGANIAEGKAKGMGREYLRYLVHAQGSANETDHWLHTCVDCELASREQVAPLLGQVLEILKILTTARATLSEQISSGQSRVREARAGYNVGPAFSAADHGGADDSKMPERENELESQAVTIPDFIDPLELDNP